MSESGINNFLKSAGFIVYVLNYYFDFKDIENPVKNYVEAIKDYRLSTHQQFYDSISLIENQYTLHDDIFELSDVGYKSFYSFEKGERSSDHYRNDPLLYLTVDLNRKIIQYERRVFSIWDMIGILGGSYGIMSVTFSMIFGFLSNKLFYHYSIKKIKFGSENKYFTFPPIINTAKPLSIKDSNSAKGISKIHASKMNDP